MKGTDHTMYSPRARDDRYPFGLAVVVVAAAAVLTLAVAVRPAVRRARRIGPSPAYQPPTWQWRSPYYGTGSSGVGQDTRSLC
jgi:hypothetical protein